MKELTKAIETATASIKVIEAATAPIRAIGEQTEMLFQILNKQNTFWASLSTSLPVVTYAQELSNILANLATPLPVIYNADGFINKIIADKEAAENNYYHNFVVNDYEQELTTERAEKEKMQRRVYELEITLREILKVKYVEPKATKTAILSLKPNLTPTQITRLSELTTGIFQATIKQWCNLFSENIQEFTEPIELTSSYLTDVRLFFEKLLQKRYIETNKYPSILYRSKAFSRNNDIITAKQINATKSNSNYPYIGNYDEINDIIERL